MKIIYQNKGGVTEDAIHGYFSSRGITPDNYQVINFVENPLPAFDVDYYLVSGYEAYKYLADNLYMGFRNSPTWEQIKRLKMIALHNGIRIIISDGYLPNFYQVADDVLYGRLPQVHPTLANNIIHKNPDDILADMDWILNNIPAGELGGIDYETTGMYDTSPKDNKNFRATGVSVSFRDKGWFWDFRFLGDRRKEVMDKYRIIVRTYQFNFYAFNALFEITTTLFEVDEYCEFCELRHFWVEDGFQEEWPTFKYMARYYLHVADWDHEFEILSEAFGEFYKLVDNHEGAWEKFLQFLKKMTPGRMMKLSDIGIDSEDKLIVDPKAGLDEPKTFKDVQLILSQFTEEDLEEFDYLCNSPLWNVSSFGIIPSRLLGYYCNLDSYYTKECVIVNTGRYSELCDDVYRMNQKYGNVLLTTGLWKDVEKFDDQWRITGKVLTHAGITLALHCTNRRLGEIYKGTYKSDEDEKRILVSDELGLYTQTKFGDYCISATTIPGNPYYGTMAPEAIYNGAKAPRGRFPTAPGEYIEVEFHTLGKLSHADQFYELWYHVSDWMNPYQVARGYISWFKEWFDDPSNSNFDFEKKKKPKWMNDEYLYWDCVKDLEKILKNNHKYKTIDIVAEGRFSDIADADRELVIKTGRDIFAMAMNYHFSKVRDKGCGEYYELKREIQPGLYYDNSGSICPPKILKLMEVPDDAPGFISDIMSGGWSLGEIYYYAKDMVISKLYNPLYEKNQDPNAMQQLFGGYDVKRAQAHVKDYKYRSLIDEVNDWIFWKQKVIDESLPKKLSVIRGLDKVFRRVISEYIGDVDAESFAITAEYLSGQKMVKSLNNIPEIKGLKSHEEIPDQITFNGNKMTLEEFQIYIFRTYLGLTGPEKYDKFAKDLMKDGMAQHKFGIIIGQYGEIYDRYIKKTDTSNMNWLDKYVTEFNEMDYSKMDIISEKNWTRRGELANVKILIINEFKNLILQLNQQYLMLRENKDGKSDQEIVDIIKEDHKRLVPEFDKFRFMGISNPNELQVLKYEAEQAAGTLEVSLQLFPEEGTLEKILNEWALTLTNSFKLVKNVVDYDTLPPANQQDFLQPYGSMITQLAPIVNSMYEKNTGRRAKDYPELIQMCLDNLTDIDKSWVFNEDLEITDWLVSHLYTASYLCERYGDEFTDEYVKYLDNMDFDSSHPLYYYKIMFMQRLFKKYNKIYTYYTGTLSQFDTKYSKYDFDRFIGTRWAEEGEKVVATIMRPGWGVNVLQSKRWNGAFHTVPSKSECKGIAGSPDDCLLSYMDISACEPRSIAKMSGDKAMQYYFDNDIDMYIECAELFLGHKILDKGQKKYFRSIFKTILLLILYNGGAATTAAQTGLTIENAQKGIDIIRSKFPVLIEYIAKKVQFCLDTDGQIDTVLGDVIWGTKGDPVKQASQGINQVIQNYASVILVYGYAHLMHMAIEKKLRIRSVSMVHDSIQCLFDIHLLPIIQSFYTEHYQTWLKGITGIFFKYDLEIGDNYYDLCSFNCSEKGFSLEGTNRSINLILNKLEKNGMPYEIVEQDNDLEEVYWNRYKDCLFAEGEAKYHQDHTWNKIIFKLKEVEQLKAA